MTEVVDGADVGWLPMVYIDEFAVAGQEGDRTVQQIVTEYLDDVISSLPSGRSKFNTKP